MSLEQLLHWLETQRFATVISQSGWIFPTVETVHVLALTVVVGSIAMIDLRLVNLAYKDRNVKELIREVLPWTWIAFIFAATFGFLLFASAATKYYGIFTFRAKMVAMALAGANMLYFHFVPFRKAENWGQPGRTSLSARICGAISLTLWVSIVALGRWTGFA